MSPSHADQPTWLVVDADQPIVAIPLIENGREVIRYAVEDDASEPIRSTTVLPASVVDALSLVGAWRDDDWDDMMDALHDLRHESQPTPPIEPTYP